MILNGTKIKHIWFPLFYYYGTIIIIIVIITGSI